MTHKTFQPEPDLCSPCVDLYGYDAVRRSTVASVDPVRSKPVHHAAPWTFRRFLADIFTPKPRRIESLPELMTGREAAARAIYGEAVQGSALDMLNYDNSPYLRGMYEAEADRRIADSKHPERYIASLHGYTPKQWDALPAVVKADLREQVTYADGFRR